MKTKFDVDVLGHLYAATSPGDFNITVHFKTTLDINRLKQALEKVTNDFPPLNGALRKGMFGYEYDVLPGLPPLLPVTAKRDRDASVFRVYYGERHFVAEVDHRLFDGRTLTKITKELLLRYFNLNGEINFQEAGLLEDAYARFAKKPQKKKKAKGKKAYGPVIVNDAALQKHCYRLSASQVKAAAKAKGVTITAYLLGVIFEAIAEERKSANCQSPIIASVPVDCRSFFPTQTLRNFVTAEHITMPEQGDILKGIQGQLAKIDKEAMQQQISEYQQLYQLTSFIPRALTDFLMKQMSKSEAKAHTTGFSNVGMLKLPDAILDQLEAVEFAIELDDNTPYYFSCITAGDVLALATYTRGEKSEVMFGLEKKLQGLFDRK